VRQVLGVGDQPLVHPVLVARPAGLDLLDVRVGLLLLTGEVVDDDLRVARLPADLGPLGGQRVELLGLRQVGQPVPQLVEPCVEVLDVQELQLGESVGLQGVLLVSGWCSAGGLRDLPGRSTGR
jgi:hypothetical protein